MVRVFSQLHMTLYLWFQCSAKVFSHIHLMWQMGDRRGLHLF